MSVTKSLEENKAQILENLPEEHHAAFEKELAKAEDPAPPTPEEELEAIKAEMKAHPDVDDAALIPEIEANPLAHRAPAPPSAEEQESAKKAALDKVGELVAPPEEEEGAEAGADEEE